MKAKIIFTKSDVYTYIDNLFREFHELQERDYVKILNIENVSVIVYKTKPLAGSSYIPLPKWIDDKKTVINIKNDNDHNCYLYRVLCGYLDI